MGRLSEALARNHGECRRRATHYSLGWGQRPGPLDRDYDPTGAVPFEVASGRMTQLIEEMRSAYESDNRIAFDSLVSEFDDCAAIVDADQWCEDLSEVDGPEDSYGLVIRRTLFPEWTND